MGQMWMKSLIHLHLQALQSTKKRKKKSSVWSGVFFGLFNIFQISPERWRVTEIGGMVMMSNELLHGEIETRRKKPHFSKKKKKKTDLWGKEMNQPLKRQTRLCVCMCACMCVGRAGKAQQQGMP